MHTAPTRRERSRRAVLATLALDLLLTASMLALFSFHLTGLLLHEWLGLAICVLVPVHLLVSWEWLAATTRRLFTRQPWRVRVRCLLNLALFVAVVVVTLSGLPISEALFPNLSNLAGNRGFWRVLHSRSSDATLLLLGLHLGIYAPKVVCMLRQLVARVRRPTSPLGAPAGRSTRAPLGV